ncbi:cytochrome C class I [Hyphomicrobium denitrificans 1NES1]|uniref:Cytochrome C class I n=1 Tax=Hyphomicrobium denitrificans 1NES1 TaxID=670307 RepID=N0B763_9HYPH|nr:cytochrome c [Hyphomicrobium denitrificans]AGK58062.1 cytochrome C class I [Hyphomicrobium denitrificans 1NES1]
MSILKPTSALVLLMCVALAGHAAAQNNPQTPHLGTPMSKTEVAKWDLTVFPDGRGLPPGHGTAKDGRAIYLQKCASCHGDEGQGATAEDLVSGPHPPTADNPSKAIGSYWPYATTIFDFIRRTMPPAAPGSLSSDEIYALTAYLLAANKIIAESDEINALSLPKIKMPNRDGFIPIDAKK